MRNGLLILIVSVLLLASCNGNDPVYYRYNTNPKYTWGYEMYFGQEYLSKGVSHNVLSLYLFSDSLSVDSTNSLTGVGQYLYLEDVFVPETAVMLPAGTYTVDNSHNSFSVAAGKNDTVDNNVFPIGAFIYYYEENSSRSVRKFITGGTMTVTHDESYNYTISCDFVTADKKTLNGTFSAILPAYDGSLYTFDVVELSRRMVLLPRKK